MTKLNDFTRNFLGRQRHTVRVKHLDADHLRNLLRTDEVTFVTVFDTLDPAGKKAMLKSAVGKDLLATALQEDMPRALLALRPKPSEARRAKPSPYSDASLVDHVAKHGAPRLALTLYAGAQLSREVCIDAFETASPETLRELAQAKVLDEALLVDIIRARPLTVGVSVLRQLRQEELLSEANYMALQAPERTPSQLQVLFQDVDAEVLDPGALSAFLLPQEPSMLDALKTVSFATLRKLAQTQVIKEPTLLQVIALLRAPLTAVELRQLRQDGVLTEPRYCDLQAPSKTKSQLQLLIEDVNAGLVAPESFLAFWTPSVTQVFNWVVAKQFPLAAFLAHFPELPSQATRELYDCGLIEAAAGGVDFPYAAQMQLPKSVVEVAANIAGMRERLAAADAACVAESKKFAELRQAATARGEAVPTVANEDLTALVNLHKTLVDTYYDLIEESLHPAAGDQPAQALVNDRTDVLLCNRGIAPVLRTLEALKTDGEAHLEGFISFATATLGFLQEIAPTFRSTWSRCAALLAMKLLPITGAATLWEGRRTAAMLHYENAVDFSYMDRIGNARRNDAAIGSFYSHLGRLHRFDDPVQELADQARAMSVSVPPAAAKKIALEVGQDMVAGTPRSVNLPPVRGFEELFIKLHGVQLKKNALHPTNLASVGESFANYLTTRRGIEDKGAFMGITNIASLLGYGESYNLLRLSLMNRFSGTLQTSLNAPLTGIAHSAVRLNFAMAEAAFERHGTPAGLPFAHVILVFMDKVQRTPNAFALLGKDFPWASAAAMGNALLPLCRDAARVQSPDFPVQGGTFDRPFPEDFAMRALIWSDDYHPSGWFSDVNVPLDERQVGFADLTERRQERVVWLLHNLTQGAASRWLTYDASAKAFSVVAQTDSYGRG